MESKVFHNNARTWVLADGVPLAGLLDRRHPLDFEGCGEALLKATVVRPYLFPFYTPAGKNLPQDYPPDHPHHQGICVGQDFINGHNFWAMGTIGQPLNQQRVRSTEHHTVGETLVFTQEITWITSTGQTDSRRGASHTTGRLV